MSAHQIDVRLDCVDGVGSPHALRARAALATCLRSEKRRRQFKRCRLCQTPTPPERLIDGRVCHGCSERRLGIVF